MLKQLSELWTDAFNKDDLFHMNEIEECVKDNFTDYGKWIFTLYIEGQKQRDIDWLIKVAADNDTEKLTRIKGIGIKTARSVIAAFSNPETLAIIDELRKAGLNFRED